jgi:outer membrane lipoprotein carrier protein
MIRTPAWLAATAGLLLAAVASTAAAGPARDRFDAFTNGLQGLDGRFVQTVHDPEGRVRETSSGRVALSAPRLFRWEYTRPYEQLIVADGRKVWVYDPDLEQVTVRPQGPEEANSPLAALLDPSRLERDYTLRDAGDGDGLSWLLVTPRTGQEAGFASAKLGFDASGLARMEVVDSLGQRTTIAFSGWTRNPRFDRGTFRYAPPKGVDVVGEG